MAFREVTVIETKEVLRLWQSGVAKKRIAAQLGLDVKTVRGYLRVAEAVDPALDLDEATAAVVERLSSANRRPRGRGWETCGEHADFIRSHLEDGVRLTKVCKLLHRQRQVRVSYMTLYRYAVEELGFGRRAATIPGWR
jgi:IS30 family transposase